MSRTPALVLVLGLVACVLAGAWWVGASDASSERIEHEEDRAELEAVEPDVLELEGGFELPDEIEPSTSTRDVVVIESAPSVALATVAVPTALSGVRGTLVDAITSEPVPDYGFDLYDRSGKHVRLTSDAAGNFEVPKPLIPGPIRAAFREGAGADSAAGDLRVASDGSAELITLRVPCGPTFRLALSPQGIPPLGELDARLRLGSRTNARERAAGAIRDGKPPWVRFHTLPADAGSEAEIVVDSEDGVWRGTAEVRLVPGIQPGVLALVLKAYSAVEVTVLDAEGLPTPDTTLELLLPGQDRPMADRVSKGKKTYGLLTADSVTLTARSPRFHPAEVHVRLVRGECVRREIRLVRAPNAGSIRGRVLSDTGTYSEKASVRLTQVIEGRGPPALECPVIWNTRNGLKTGHFAFDDLPPGRWRVAIAENDWFEWEPRRVDVDAPRDGVEFRVHDSVPVADLVFEPRDENGVAWPGAFDVRLMVRGEPRLYRGHGGSALVAAFPVDSPLRWRIDAPARATVFGGWSDLAPLSSVDGRERRGSAAILERGWAQTFRVVRQDNSKAIQGATALVDGREAGVTGADGRIVLRAESKPTRVQFRHKDWKMRGNASLGPSSGSLEFENVVRFDVPKNTRKRP